MVEGEKKSLKTKHGRLCTIGVVGRSEQHQHGGQGRGQVSEVNFPLSILLWVLSRNTEVREAERERQIERGRAVACY